MLYAERPHLTGKREYFDKIHKLEKEIEKRKCIVRRLQETIKVLGGVAQDILAELNDDSFARIRPEESYISYISEPQNYAHKERTEVEVEGFGKF